MGSKRVLAVAAILAAAAAVIWYRGQVFGERPAGPRPNIVVVTGGSGDFWQLIGNGAQAAAKEFDVNLDLRMPEKDEDLDRQIQLLSNIDLDKVDGVAVSPLDADGQASLINRVAERALVVTMDSDAPQTARHSYVGTSNIAAGKKCAQLVKEALPEGGAIAVLMANTTKENMIKRKQGFEEELTRGPNDGPTYEVVQFLVDDGDPMRNDQQLRQLIEDHAELGCLVGMNAQHGPRILKILGDLDKLDVVKVVAFDEVKETLDGVAAGHIFATVTQDPYQYGYQSVRTLAELHRATEAQRPMPGSNSTLSISTRVVRQGDVDDFRAVLASRLKPAG